LVMKKNEIITKTVLIKMDFIIAIDE